MLSSEKNKLELISPNKRLTRVLGKGVQFLPGYPEPFNDVVEKFISKLNVQQRILEFGGGGLSCFLRMITLPQVAKFICVDPDVSALNYTDIIEHYNLGSAYEDASAQKGVFVGSDIATFFKTFFLKDAPTIICALRVVHFLSPEEFEAFLHAAYQVLADGGYLIISALAFNDYDNPDQLSEFFRWSEPIDGCEYYRRLDATNPQAQALLADQNLQPEILFFDPAYIQEVMPRSGFSIVCGPERSTRVVDGYIFKKTAKYEQ